MLSLFVLQKKPPTVRKLQQDPKEQEEPIGGKAVWHVAFASPSPPPLAPGPHRQAPAKGIRLNTASLTFNSLSACLCQPQPVLATLGPAPSTHPHLSATNLSTTNQQQPLMTHQHTPSTKTKKRENKRKRTKKWKEEK